MAAIVRRTWAEIRTEAILRLGNLNATGFDARVGYWLWAAYLDLCLTYHHFELDAVDTTKALTTANNEVDLPADCFIVSAVKMLAVGGATVLGPLVLHSFQSLMDEYDPDTAARPGRYARYGTKLYVEKKPDAAYPLHIYYYKFPTAPDFASGSPVTSVDLDEHLIEATLAKGWPALARPDLGAVAREQLGDWLARQVRPENVVESLANLKERQQSTRTIGGAQG